MPDSWWVTAGDPVVLTLLTGPTGPEGPPGPPGEPGLPGDAVNLAHLHTQDAPSTVWLVTHGLPFVPAAVDVVDHVGVRHHPDVTWPDAATVRLDFLTDVRGTARLS